MGSGHFLISGLILGLTGCANVPYWQDPKWINSMGNAIQESVVYPDDLLRDAYREGKFVSGKAVVRFRYDKGRIDSVAIIKSTGNKVLDAAIEKAVTHTSLPAANGSDASNSRRFQVPVSIGPGDSGLYRDIQHQLERHVVFPELAMVNLRDGVVIAGFKYRNGIVMDPTIIKSGDPQMLNQAVLDALHKARLRPSPAWLQNRTLKFEVPVCFSLDHAYCPGMSMGIEYVITGQSDKPKTK